MASADLASDLKADLDTVNGPAGWASPTVTAGDALPSSPSSGAPLKVTADHMPQLDGLRMIAALSVILHHYWPQYSERVRAGQLGVPLFFVLSGFLITGILLRCRRMVDEQGRSFGTAMRNFYVRRSLRIFPLYYGVLTAVWVLRIRPLGHEWPWHYLYVSNFFFATHANVPGAMTSIGHFWSLAVEEQFYLVWPWLVMLAPRKLLLPIFVAIIAIAPPFRAALTAHGWSMMSVSMFTTSAVDKLAMGALLALVSDSRVGLRKYRNAFLWAVLCVGLPLVVVGNVMWAHVEHTARSTATHSLLSMAPLASAIQPLGGALLFAWLVGRAADGFRGPIGWFLAWRPVTYLGQISYGIYVYHGLMQVSFHKLHLRIANPNLMGLAMFAATIIVASASFHLFESPINRLKRFFEYSGDKRPATAGRRTPRGVPVEPVVPRTSREPALAPLAE